VPQAFLEPSCRRLASPWPWSSPRRQPARRGARADRRVESPGAPWGWRPARRRWAEPGNPLPVTREAGRLEQGAPTYSAAPFFAQIARRGRPAHKNRCVGYHNTVRHARNSPIRQKAPSALGRLQAGGLGSTRRGSRKGPVGWTDCSTPTAPPPLHPPLRLRDIGTFAKFEPHEHPELCYQPAPTALCRWASDVF
jgi:hypothetical protein